MQPIDGVINLCYGAVMKDDSENLAPQCYVKGDEQLVRLARSAGLGPDAASAVATIDAVMGRIRRSMMKRELGKAIIEHLKAPLEVAHMDVIGILGGMHEDVSADEITVGFIAEKLAIDPSRASRLAAEVVDRGFAKRVASQADARRICLALTPKGRAFVEKFRETKWRIFANALGEWDENELIVFARLLERFSLWTSEGVRLDTATKTAAE
jgi:DNA-binding MarR family transcriptional regulator